MERKNKKTKSVGNGEGSLYYSDKLKCWIFQYYDTQNKRKTMKQKKKESVKDFKARVTTIKNRLNTGTYVEKTNETLLDILQHHIDQKFNDGILSEASYKRNLETLEQMKKTCALYINKPIQKITIEDIERSKKNIRETYSQSCIDKIWGLLYKVFKIAYSRKKIMYNIMEDETLIKPISCKEKKNIEALTIQEQQRLEHILNNEEKNHEYANIVKMQLLTGMRIGEVLARTKDNINFKNNTILVNNTLTKDKNDKTIIGKHTKTYNKRTGVDNGIRTIQFNEELKSILSKQINKNITNIYNLIFWDYKKNTFISNGEVNSWLTRLNKKYNITNKKLSSHILRHTRITRWKELGVDMKVIQYWAGHVEGSNITDNVYVSLTEDFIKQEYKKIN